MRYEIGSLMCFTPKVLPKFDWVWWWWSSLSRVVGFPPPKPPPLRCYCYLLVRKTTTVRRRLDYSFRQGAKLTGPNCTIQKSTEKPIQYVWTIINSGNLWKFCRYVKKNLQPTMKEWFINNCPTGLLCIGPSNLFCTAIKPNVYNCCRLHRIPSHPWNHILFLQCFIFVTQF